MDERWCDELDLQVATLRACWALAPDADPEASAATLEAVAYRLRALAGEARRAVLEPELEPA